MRRQSHGFRGIGVSELSDEAYYDGFDAAVVRVDWFVSLVCGVEPYAGILFVEALEGCVFVIYYCDDELAVGCGRSALADDVITIVNVIVDHAVAADFEGECVVVDSEVGFERERIRILNGMDGRSCGDTAEEGYGFMGRLGRLRRGLVDAAKQFLRF